MRKFNFHNKYSDREIERNKALDTDSRWKVFDLGDGEWGVSREGPNWIFYKGTEEDMIAQAEELNNNDHTRKTPVNSVIYYENNKHRKNKRRDPIREDFNAFEEAEKRMKELINNRIGIGHEIIQDDVRDMTPAEFEKSLLYGVIFHLDRVIRPLGHLLSESVLDEITQTETQDLLSLINKMNGKYKNMRGQIK